MKDFLKREAVLSVSCVLALASCFLIKPSAAYIDYIDFRSLAILLSLMLTTAGLKAAAVPDAIGVYLLQKAGNTRKLCLALMLLCFFTAMFITNDVALITFVSFAVFTLEAAGRGQYLLPVVVLQTMAANLGSMLTPMGNPQNLYLYRLSGMGGGEFIAFMAPAALLSLALLVVLSLFIVRDGSAIHVRMEKPQVRKKAAWLFGGLFLLCLLTVLRVVDCRISLAAVCLAAAFTDRKLFRGADWSLLLTFVFLFIFTGNLGAYPPVSRVLAQLVSGREMLSGVLCSQVISNVPAALLLSGFSENLRGLLLGVNLGGLGTLIASMASLISFRLFVKERPAEKGKYLALFTLENVGMLLVLYLACTLLY